MSNSWYEQYGRPVLAALVVALALLSVVSAYFQISELGLTAVGDALVSLYIAGLVVWGFFREGFDTFRFRAMLYFGVLLWGTVDWLGGSESAFTYVLIIAGAILLARTVYQEYNKQSKPVYER